MAGGDNRESVGRAAHRQLPPSSGASRTRTSTISREQVAALTRTVEHLVTREHEFRSSQEVVAEVAEAVVDDLEQRGDLARDSLDDARDDRDDLDDDGGTPHGFY